MVIIRVAGHSLISERIEVGDEVKLNTVVWEVRSGGWVKMLGMWWKLETGESVTAGDRIKAVGNIKAKLIRNSQVEIVSQHRSLIIVPGVGRWFSGLNEARMLIDKKISRWFVGDVGALISGILLGGSGQLSVEMAEAFRKTGLMHVVAASGYNVVVVAGWVMSWWQRWLNRRLAIWFGILSICLYALLAGMSTPVIRAAIMASISLAGLYWGRKSDGGWLLIWTGLIMLLVRPDWWYDVGWQLSVAATAGLIMFTGQPEIITISLERQHRGIAEEWLGNLQTTLAAQLLTAPLILHYFGQMGVWSPAVNMLALWTIPLLMEMGAVVLVGGLIWDPIGQLGAMVMWPLASYVLLIVTWGAGWPGSGWQVGNLGWGWVGVYYALVGTSWWLLMKKKKQ